MHDPIKTLETTYLWMLVNLTGVARIRCDGLFAEIRDTIAEARGICPQEVQETAEHEALMERHPEMKSPVWRKARPGEIMQLLGHR